MQLWLSDIVAKEVMRHRLDAVRRAVLQIKGGYADLERLVRPELALAQDADRHVAAAIHRFDRQLHAFVRSHGGTILEGKSPTLAAQLFEFYFDQRPPFGGGRDKKHEFPDAATLLMLESHARSNGVKVIAVSADEGWKAFAKHSEEVFCLGSLRELTGLFVATSPGMQQFAARVADTLSSASFKEEVRRLLVKQITSLPWIVEARGSGYDVDAGVVNAIVDDIQIKEDSLRLWSTSPDETAGVAHVAVEVETRLEIEAYAYEHKYKSLEKEDLARTSLVVNQGVELFLALEFLGIHPELSVMAALRNVSVLTEPLQVQVGKVRFPGLPQPRWSLDDMDDDVPF
jgi:hypothetical protein